jgi:hypothetical protein
MVIEEINREYLPRDQARVEALSLPQEGARLEARREFLDDGIGNLKDHVQNATAELVFNLDEFGPSALVRVACRTVLHIVLPVRLGHPTAEAALRTDGCHLDST